MIEALATDIQQYWEMEGGSAQQRRPLKMDKNTDDANDIDSIFKPKLCQRNSEIVQHINR